MNDKLKRSIKKSALYKIMSPFLEILGLKKGLSKQQIKTILKGIEKPLILEIGCNDGSDSVEFLETFKKLKLYCFEPDPRAIEKFNKKIDDSRCELNKIAISDKNGRVIFHLSGGKPPNRKDKDWDKSSSIKTPAKHLELCPWCNFDKKISVKTKKLDSWLKERKIDIIDFIWADVQGAERELIEGGIMALNEKTRYFYTEFNNDELYEGQPKLSEILKLLPNFRVIKEYDNNVLLKNIILK